MASHQLVGDEAEHARPPPLGPQCEVDARPVDAHRRRQRRANAWSRIVEKLAAARHQPAAVPDEVGPQVAQVAAGDQVGAPPRRHRAAVEQPEVLGGVERRHADRRQRVDAAGDRHPHQRVHVPLVEQVGGLAVVGAQAQPPLGARVDERQQVAQVLRVGRLAQEDDEAGRAASRAPPPPSCTRGRSAGRRRRRRRARRRRAPARGRRPAGRRRRRSSPAPRHRPRPPPGSSSPRRGRARAVRRRATTARRRRARHRSSPGGSPARTRAPSPPSRTARRAASSSIQRTPSTPSTLAISCGSATMVVVPRGTTARAISAGGTMLLSTWTWASISPGSTQAPSSSTTSRPR